MSSMANITAFDGAGTPVIHTLYADSIRLVAPGVQEAVWKELLAVPDEAQTRFVIRRSTLPSGVQKVSARLQISAMEAILNQNAAGYTAAPKIAFYDAAELILHAHPRSTIASRRLVRQMLLNICGNVSTSVTPVTTGFVPEALDALIMPV